MSAQLPMFEAVLERGGYRGIVSMPDGSIALRFPRLQPNASKAIEVVAQLWDARQARHTAATEVAA